MKVLFCGLGSIGQRHLRNLRTLYGEKVEILAWRQRGGGPVLNEDMTICPGAELEKTYGLRTFTDLELALSEKPDVAFITNPNSFHLTTALAAARAGCHLFIEKPVADSLEGLDELACVVDHLRLVTFVAYQFRFHPGLRRVKALLDSGRLGRIVAAHIVNGEYLPDWHPWEDYRMTHPARRELGGGCLRIQTHELDYALWLFGMPRRVYAVGGHLSRLELNVEDSVSLLLHCERDNRAVPVQIHLDYLQRPPQRICEVIGDSGRVRFDYYRQVVEFWELDARTHEVVQFEKFERNEMFLAEQRHFWACIQGTEKPLVDLTEGIRSLKIALAASASMECGRSIEVV
jgi:predicted dehydrogenase